MYSVNTLEQSFFSGKRVQIEFIIIYIYLEF